MAEQWPFKPFVEGSSPPELTKKSSVFGGLFCFVERPRRGMIFESSELTKSIPFSEGFYVLLSVPAGGMIFESSELTKSLPLSEGFL